MMKLASMRWFVLPFLLACSEEVSETVPTDYEMWPDQGGYKWITCGPAPGHGDTCRVIYANDKVFEYPAPPSTATWHVDGAIFVKEIRDNVDGEPGDLQYLSLMRRQGEIMTGLEDEGGWLFTQASTPTSPEVYRSLCWGRCHVAAPFNGTFCDYRRDPRM